MASRKNPKSGSPGHGARREAKHGGHKNGKKEGLSGSSFFTWFMVIALLGVWTSVAVVWFELVDYEEVLAKAKDFRYNLSEVLQGKLGIYDADGDGDFDVDDAKVLLGLKERSVTEQQTPRDAEEVIQTAEQPRVKAEHRSVEAEPEDEIESLLRDVLNSQLEGPDEENVHEETNFQEENSEILEDAVEVPAVEEDYDGELEDKIPEALETPRSIQREAESDYQPGHPEADDTHDSYEYHTPMEEGTYEPEAPDDPELTLEDALDHDGDPISESAEQQDYVDEHELEHEDFIEVQDTDEEPLTEHYYEHSQEPIDNTEQHHESNTEQHHESNTEQHRENEADASDSVTKHTEMVDEREHEEIHVAEQPHVTEVPVQADDRSNDDVVDT